MRAGSPWQHALAAIVFLGCALWAMRAVLPAPATTFPRPLGPPPSWRRIIDSDQKLSAAMITWNASRFVTRPWKLYDAGQCYPAAHPSTLGPHMLGDGLLGVIPYALSRDPVLTYNAEVVLTLWLPALAMYALAFAFTRSAPAAFIAGLLFAMHPQRLADVVHPDVHGNYWTPLALLFAHRTFAHGRWRDAAGLATFIGLQLLVSVYALLSLVVLGSAYGVFLVVRHVRRMRVLAPKLAAVVLAVSVLAWLVLGPYLETRARWGTLGGRTSLFYNLRDFTLGRAAYPGSVLVGLAAVGLADRLRGRRRGDDPRLPFVVGGLLTVWAAIWWLPVPGLTTPLPSLFTLASRLLPGLDAVRAGADIGFGAILVGAFLAAYGVVVLLERRAPATRAVVTGLLATAIVVEVFHPRIAKYSFASTFDMAPYRVRPPAALLDLYAQTAEGAVLDLPYSFALGQFFEMADGVFLSAYHLHPVAACYDSFKLPLHDDLERMTARLGQDDRVVDELHALGFGTLVIDDVRALRARRPNLVKVVMQQTRLVLAGRAAAHSAYRLPSSAPVEASFTALAAAADAAVAAAAPATGPAGATPAAAGASPGVVNAAPPTASLAFRFRNGSGATYRHPDPIEPTRVAVRWRRDGAVIRDDEIATLLPLALAAGEETSRSITLPVPSADGDYEVTLAPALTPDLVLARLDVHVDGERR